LIHTHTIIVKCHTLLNNKIYVTLSTYHNHQIFKSFDFCNYFLVIHFDYDLLIAYNFLHKHCMHIKLDQDVSSEVLRVNP
jgi:hypothetical protein